MLEAEKFPRGQGVISRGRVGQYDIFQAAPQAVRVGPAKGLRKG